MSEEILLKTPQHKMPNNSGKKFLNAFMYDAEKNME